jgi:hypothetical protein
MRQSAGGRGQLFLDFLRGEESGGTCPAGQFLGSGTVWWGEATDEPAREDARPTNMETVPLPISTAQKLARGKICEALSRPAG